MNPTITIIDDLHPEDNAMLQALQSRSPASVAERLEKVRKSGSGEFMGKFYVGYGHKSIGDCGTTTIYIEGVTMLMAKAIQDWALYSGQEASTRYMDFSSSVFHNPMALAAGERINEAWRQFYLEATDPVRAHLRERYPIGDDEDSKVYDRAINARSFDILRSFLPAGAATNLSWHTNLRQAADHLGWLIYHPDNDIRDTAVSLLDQLKAKYTGSFQDRPLTKEQVEYKRDVMQKFYFLQITSQDVSGPAEVKMYSTFDQAMIDDASMTMLTERPKGVEVPRFLAELGNVTSEFMLDFGSYRDIQRHRAGIIRMPLLQTRFGFNDWYLSELPEDLRDRAVGLISRQTDALASLDCDPVHKQNYIAMGFQVPVRVTQGLPALVYRLELRSGKTVHPSLRRVIHTEIKRFRNIFPDVALYVDEDPDSWTVRRGKQTITEKT